MKNIYFTVVCANYVFQNRFNELSLQFFIIDFPISLGQLINNERHAYTHARLGTYTYTFMHTHISVCLYMYIYPRIRMLFKAHH